MNSNSSSLPTEAAMRAAVRTRDAAFDGVFFYGVVTTGVFCQPSCGARPARPENLRFFATADAAQAAGLRPCRRCRPLHAGRERELLIQLARLMEADPAERHTLAMLGSRVGMTPQRLRRSFRALFGTSPRAFQERLRLQRFRDGLANGESVTTATHAAGYGSTSRVYEPAARDLGMTPRAYRTGGAGETISWAARQTPLGWLLMAATDRGLCCVQFGTDTSSLVRQLRAVFPRARLVASAATHSAPLDDWMHGLFEHLAHHAPRPDLPLDLRGTAFQVEVWRYLTTVPAGQVISYAELACAVGRPGAARAAGSACAANRIAVMIPCHRVLRADGSLGGYRWGVERKRALIEAEQQGQDGRQGRIEHAGG